MEYDKIKQLMEDMGNSKLTSIDIDFADGTKIKMTKQNNQTIENNCVIEENNNKQEKIENLQGIVEENSRQKTDYSEKTKEKKRSKAPLFPKKEKENRLRPRLDFFETALTTIPVGGQGRTASISEIYGKVT